MAEGVHDVPLEGYWEECSRFDEGATHEDEEDESSKTPDEGEVEEEWLREAGLESLIDSKLPETEQAALFEGVLSTLTPRQGAVVRKRLDTVQRSKKRRYLRNRQRADVRDLFGPHPPLSASPPRSLPSSFRADPPCSDSPSLPVCLDPPPLCKSSSKGNVLPPLPFLRTGGFSLDERHHSGGIDCESPTSVEVLRYESRSSVIEDGDDSYDSDCATTASIGSSLETGFQEISSRMDSIGDLPTAISSDVQMGELGEEDRVRVRSLAIIEVAALLDAHGLVPARRRRKADRKKGKENVVLGASLTSLLEMDRKRAPGLKIPLIYQWIFHHLHGNGLREEGLMRLAGSVQKIQLLKSEVERGYASCPVLLENLIRQSSVHDASGLLKQLVRHLPDPLLTHSHMDAFLQVPNIPDTRDQVNALNLLVLALPDSHRELLQELLFFLSRVVGEEASNRMSLSNVAMIMAPNLFPPPRLKKGQDLAAEVTVAALSSKVTRMLVQCAEILGTVPLDLLAQARLQHRSQKHPKKLGGRKAKGDKQKNTKEESSCAVIRVQLSSLRAPGSVAVAIDARTTAGDVVARVAEALDPTVDRPHAGGEENRAAAAFVQRARTTSEPVVFRHRCLVGAKKSSDCLKDHHLYYIRENVGERRLDPLANIACIAGSGSTRFATGSTWEIRCHH